MANEETEQGTRAIDIYLYLVVGVSVVVCLGFLVGYEKAKGEFTVDVNVLVLLFGAIGISLLPCLSRLKIAGLLDMERLSRDIREVGTEVKELLLRREVVRGENGDLYYIDNSLGRHQMPDDATGHFFAGPKGEISLSTKELERYPLTEPMKMESVRACEILYLEPGPHIYVLLSGRTKYVGIPDLTRWGRQKPEQWQHVDEKAFRGYPSWD